MIIDKKTQKLTMVEHGDGTVTGQVVPSDKLIIAKLERRIAELPAKHPKRARYQKQLKALR